MEIHLHAYIFFPLVSFHTVHALTLENALVLLVMADRYIFTASRQNDTVKLTIMMHKNLVGRNAEVVSSSVSAWLNLA